MSKHRVVVTGLGMLSPCGTTVEESWKAILNGQSGISAITEFDTTDYPTKFAGLVPEFDLEHYMSIKDARKMDPFIQYGMVSAIQAIKQSGLMESTFDPTRVGVSIGSGIGGLTLIENTTLLLKAWATQGLSIFCSRFDYKYDRWKSCDQIWIPRPQYRDYDSLYHLNALLGFWCTDDCLW